MNHIGTIRLETDRLILRRFTIADAEGMFNNWASDDDVTKYLTWPTHQNVEMTREYINYCLQGYSESAFYTWVMESKESHELIGSISVVKIDEVIDGLELGWAIGKKFWGKGYTAEAAKAVLDVLFDKVGANCIYAQHDVNNPNSGRVMQKIGMKYEGTLRQSDRNNQGIADMAHYSIIRDER
ncbi:MAG: GNAT family N-acetyltransferase [Ruminococcus sp.]|nr:GNAT family N-acetyltransferase [Ruminococcus sp.]